jgi:hypothetical protein
MSGTDGSEWKRCSSCKKAIAFESTYYACSVSTCNKKRGGFVFCSVDCWDQHVPMMRHRDAWAVEETAPTEAQHARETAGDATTPTEPKPIAKPSTSTASSPVRRRIVGGTPEPAAPATPGEVLVVASRFKSYIRERFGMNTSDGVLEPLSDELRRLAARAVQHAREDGRKTVLERDFEFLRAKKD